MNISAQGRKGAEEEGETRRSSVAVVPPPPPRRRPQSALPPQQQAKAKANTTTTSDTVIPLSPVAGRDSTGRIQEGRANDHPAGVCIKRLLVHGCFSVFFALCAHAPILRFPASTSSVSPSCVPSVFYFASTCVLGCSLTSIGTPLPPPCMCASDVAFRGISTAVRSPRKRKYCGRNKRGRRG